MSNENRVWLGAVATYTGGYSYTVGQQFVNNRPTKVKTRKIRDAIFGKPGFHVVDRWEEEEVKVEKPKPEPKPVVTVSIPVTPTSVVVPKSEPVSEPEPEPKTEKKSEPKKPRSTKVKVARKLLKKGSKK